MKIAIVGLGYVGVTAACCLAKQGHQIVGVDVSQTKVTDIAAGICPINEPGLADLLNEALAANRISAAPAFPLDNADIDMAIVCVGTPSGPDGAHNMSFVAEATRQLAETLERKRTRPLALVYRSTFRPGTMESLIAPIIQDCLGDDHHLIELIYNPEFLREATAVDDFFNPPRIVVGTATGEPSALVDEMNKDLQSETFYVTYRESEFTKFADNTWHAVKVAYANEIGRVCQELGIDPKVAHRIFVADAKLNLSDYYLRPGGPFGGSCLPKDVRALQHLSSEHGANTHLIDSLLRSNEAHKNHQFRRVAQRLPSGGKVLVSGLAFKAETDDLRESPNVDLVRRLLGAGYSVRVFDPALVPERLLGQNLGYAYSHLPQLTHLLIDAQQASAERFDVYVRTNATFDRLELGPDAVTVDLSTLSND